MGRTSKHRTPGSGSSSTRHKGADQYDPSKRLTAANKPTVKDPDPLFKQTDAERKARYLAANKRLFFLDLDGTLIRQFPDPPEWNFDAMTSDAYESIRTLMYGLWYCDNRGRLNFAFNSANEYTQLVSPWEYKADALISQWIAAHGGTTDYSEGSYNHGYPRAETTKRYFFAPGQQHLMDDFIAQMKTATRTPGHPHCAGYGIRVHADFEKGACVNAVERYHPDVDWICFARSRRALTLHEHWEQLEMMASWSSGAA
ncbi:hypothetical protein MNV49_005099 [Pseudohyphozyma bogoriensis]|nr:hypothetical protein MNV49_005099 [Pseudohyphozyma bogoriensis]